MTMREIDKVLWTWVTKAVSDWYNTQVSNTYGSYYLYYKLGAITIAERAPEGFTLASAQRISPAWTKDEAEVKVRNMLSRLPIIDFA